MTRALLPILLSILRKTKRSKVIEEIKMKLKVMTFNLRYRTENDGVNFFDNRAPRVIETIKKEAPDLIGFQEATDFQRDFLRRELSDSYIVLGCGRGSNYRGEAPCLAYRRDMFELVKYDTFWLSDTPHIAGSRYESLDQSGCPRYTAYAVLSPDGYEGSIAFFNTHLDHKGEQARIAGMKQTAEAIKALGGKFVLTGDMNDFPDSKCIAVAKEIEGAVDAAESVTHTFHNFGKIKDNYKIDYIFTNTQVLGAYAVEDIPTDGVYISDHYPVCAYIDLI